MFIALQVSNINICFSVMYWTFLVEILSELLGIHMKLQEIVYLVFIGDLAA